MALLTVVAVGRRPRNEIVARVDGHAEIPVDYPRVAVAELVRAGADNVGGVMDARGVTAFKRAVACAMHSRLGVGTPASMSAANPARPRR